jgi:hypothetical protein
MQLMISNSKSVVADWHEVFGNDEEKGSVRCHQCLAGSVMSRRLNAPLFTDASPYQYERNVAMRLMALNSFRVGAIWEAYDRLDIDQPETLPRNVTITHYKIDKNLFKSQMRQLADRIETAHKVQAKLDLFEQIKNLMD